MYIPFGVFHSDEEDEAALKRKRLAEALRSGKDVSVTPTGQVITKAEKDANPDIDTMNIPEGKLA